MGNPIKNNLKIYFKLFQEIFKYKKFLICIKVVITDFLINLNLIWTKIGAVYIQLLYKYVGYIRLGQEMNVSQEGGDQCLSPFLPGNAVHSKPNSVQDKICKKVGQEFHSLSDEKPEHSTDTWCRKKFLNFSLLPSRSTRNSCINHYKRNAQPFCLSSKGAVFTQLRENSEFVLFLSKRVQQRLLIPDWDQASIYKN